MLNLFPTTYLRLKDLRDFYKEQGCIITGGPAVFHHEAITERGTSIKAPDTEGLPIDPALHNRRHEPGMGMVRFWSQYIPTDPTLPMWVNKELIKLTLGREMLKLATMFIERRMP